MKVNHSDMTAMGEQLEDMHIKVHRLVRGTHISEVAKHKQKIAEELAEMYWSAMSS